MDVFKGGAEKSARMGPSWSLVWLDLNFPKLQRGLVENEDAADQEVRRKP